MYVLAITPLRESWGNPIKGAFTVTDHRGSWRPSPDKFTIAGGGGVCKTSVRGTNLAHSKWQGAEDGEDKLVDCGGQESNPGQLPQVGRKEVVLQE